MDIFDAKKNGISGDFSVIKNGISGIFLGIFKEMLYLCSQKIITGLCSKESLPKSLEAPEYGIERAIVFSNEREIYKKKGVTYMSVYYSMFLHKETADADAVILPELETVRESLYETGFVKE